MDLVLRENKFNVGSITKNELLRLIEQYSYDTCRKILHVRENKLFNLLKKYNIKREPKWKRRTYPEIIQEQKEFIFGSLLGDMSVVKKYPQCRLSISHGHKQIEYLKHKKQILGELSLNNIQIANSKEHTTKMFFNNKFNLHTIKEFHGHILHSKVHPFFTELRHRLYPNNKKTISEWWLNQVTERSLAYWIMDDGSADYSDNSFVYVISTCCFTYEEHLLLQKFFNDKFNIILNIQKVNRGHGYASRFRTKDSRQLRELIRPYIIPSMQYKINKI
jgi:hypothetical protein